MEKLALFASGSGSNAIKILEYFNGHKHIEVVLIFVNNPKAGILEKLRPEPECIVDGSTGFINDGKLLQILQERKITGIVLAGFLKLLPIAIIKAFSNRILNIHPSLLPKFGGKGMYGMHVHRAVIQANEKESGISIHLVNEIYDQGEILLQRALKINKNWSPEVLQQEVLKLEHRYFAPSIERYFLHQIN